MAKSEQMKMSNNTWQLLMLSVSTRGGGKFVLLVKQMNKKFLVCYPQYGCNCMSLQQP